MTSKTSDLHSRWTLFIAFFAHLLVHSQGLNNDGNLLLSFKNSVLSDPLGFLHNWHSHDQTPCSWAGVTCNTPGVANATSRVTSLSLPNAQLLASIPPNLGLIQHLRTLNLSNNSINGSIPSSLFQATELQILDLSNNLISGELSQLVGGLISLFFINLSNNALGGTIPESLTNLGSLTVVSLKSNYFTGNLPSGFGSVQIVDLSSNLINGSLPADFKGISLQYLNLSYNRLSGEIPTQFANQIPTNATIDLSFNNLSGEIPEISLFVNQDPVSYSGNPELCGGPLKNPCPVPSTISTQPNGSAPTSTPAIAAIPKTIDSSPDANSSSGQGSGSGQNNGLRTGTVVGIVVGDVAGVLILGLVFLYVYQVKKRKSGVNTTNAKSVKVGGPVKDYDWSYSSSEDEESRKGIRALACLRKKSKAEEESSDSVNSDGENSENGQKGHDNQEKQEQKGGALVTVDGEKQLELETLLKASAYILGATGSSIMYKAVLEDGTTMAVRRIGESGVERFKDFENQVRVIAKLVHPNLVRIRGFYWAADEKLVIYDFVPNGSLANARYRKVGSSPCHLPWEVRLKIAKGIARGLTYIHEKKHVHGNLKPSNILLGSDMEPKIGDFGLERLVTGESGYKPGASARNFGSKRSTASRESFHDHSIGATPSPSPSSMGCISPYYAPESLRSIKPNSKWDVYSFGVVLLELLTGKVIVSDELGPGPGGLMVEDKTQVLKMADVAIRADLDGKEDALLSLLRLGFNCLSPTPHKRPTMKEALQALEKFPSSSSSSSSSFYLAI
ncbi:hypothetical protein RHMOL_Rhmol10G0144200 [Rhododendron molle]|uniref:Uncharacterized protein n=1 Tax=Rhododendron molle TaxID=49168 RepID=A0ACC0M293_RHOML|nr:hypothetical protein RHMOL_Rhmol10G0144200 [Rhododendron molle]